MKKFFRVLDIIFEIATPILFVAYAIAIMFFSNVSVVSDNYIVLLSVLLIVQGVALICDFIGGHKIKQTINFNVAFGICSIVLGVVFMAKNIELKQLCLIWGIFEIIKGAFEVQNIIVLLKKKDFIAFLELICAATEIVFGTLLVIHTEEDIHVHLIVVGIVFILSAVTQVLNTVIENRKKSKE